MKSLANGSKPKPRKKLSSKADCSSLKWMLSEALSFLSLNRCEARCRKAIGFSLDELPGIVSGQAVKSGEWSNSLMNRKPELTFDTSTFQFKELLKSLSCVPLSSTVWVNRRSLLRDVSMCFLWIKYFSALRGSVPRVGGLAAEAQVAASSWPRFREYGGDWVLARGSRLLQ